MTARSRALALLAALFMAAGCGVKAPPRPPAKPVPAEPEGFHARVREGCVELAWRPATVAALAGATVAAGTTAGRVPGQVEGAAAGTTAGQVPGPVVGATADAAPKPAPAPAPTGAAARAAGRAVEAAAALISPPAESYEVLRAEEPAASEAPVFAVAAQTRETSWRDCAPAAGAGYLFQVRPVSADGRRGKETRKALVKIAAPLPAPGKLTAKAGDRFVELSWRRPAGLPEGAAFNIYRSKDPDRFGWQPVNPQPLTATTYADGPVENGTKYFYQVRAAMRPEKAAVVEGPAATAAATPVDKVPPSAPAGLTAAFTGKAVEMRWFKNQEPDLKGYLVYRRTGEQGNFQRLTPTPIADTGYIDKTAKRGREYQYLVTAVDTSDPPNESAASEMQTVYLTP
jgi:hypothetical protein